MNPTDTAVDTLLAAHPSAAFRVTLASGLQIVGTVARTQPATDQTDATLDQHLLTITAASGQARHWYCLIDDVVALTPLA